MFSNSFFRKSIMSVVIVLMSFQLFCQQSTTNRNLLLLAKDSLPLIVRIPVNSSKIRYAQQSIANAKTSKDSLYFSKLLTETVLENQSYFQLLYNSFEAHYSATSVYYIPDSLYTAFTNGNKAVFLDKTNKVNPSIQLTSSEYLMLIAGNDKEQLILVDKNLIILDKPFPHKKSSFLRKFKAIFNKNDYIEQQVIWLDNELKKVKTHAIMRSLSK